MFSHVGAGSRVLPCHLCTVTHGVHRNLASSAHKIMVVAAAQHPIPSPMAHSAAMDALLRNPHVWRGDRYANVAIESIPTGFSSLDEQLPGGGWPGAALTEVLTDRQGIGELSLLMPALSRLSSRKEWIVWIAPSHIPYAPALGGQGVDLSKVVILHAATEQEKIWAAEKCLRSQACSAVLLWACAHNHQTCRRLQLAAEAGRTWGVIFGPAQWARHTSPAALRLMLSAEQGRLKTHLLKRRGGGALPELFLDGGYERTHAGDHDHTSPPPSTSTPTTVCPSHRLRQQVA